MQAASYGVNRARDYARGKPTPVCGPYIDAACKFVKRTLCPATRYLTKPNYRHMKTNDGARMSNVTRITVLRRS